MNSIWIAREKYGYLYMFKTKPIRCDNHWEPSSYSNGDYCAIDDDWFPELNWEDDPIELVPKIMIDNNSIEDIMKDFYNKLIIDEEAPND